MSELSRDLSMSALDYHERGRPGKLEIIASKPLANQHDLALAYSPGVAAVSEAIHKDPSLAARYTARANLVAVISNGTAVLGLGDIGPLAAKPVMEGKAVLFKKFADIDVFDIELDSKIPEALINIISALEPTFGGILLEDIKGPECFEIEERCREQMKIPVFHDDQHGTAIIVGAAVLNGLRLSRKKIEHVKIVACGAGAAGIACLNQLISLGAKLENIWLCDIEGVVWKGRPCLMDPYKEKFAQATDKRHLSEIIDGADIFLGLSAGGILKAEYLKRMATDPLIMALANPYPEIMPEEAHKVRPDAILCTGRSDYPNQVNNVICFPYIFRGALDVGATKINEEMKRACIEAIAALAREAPSDVVAHAYGGETRLFGKDCLIPSPFDPRLILRIAPAVARAAMETGVASRPIVDFQAYRDRLERHVFRSGFIMKEIFSVARSKPKRVIYSDGEDERVLRAAQILLEEGLAKPILVGRPAVIEQRLNRFGLSLQPYKDFDLIDPENDQRYKEYVATYNEISGRFGVTLDAARILVRTSTTVIAALAVYRCEADAMICGLEGSYRSQLQRIKSIIGLAPRVNQLAAMTLMITKRNELCFLADTHAHLEHSASSIADMVLLSSEHVKRFGITPKVALISSADFGEHDSPTSRKLLEALDIIRALSPDLEIDGEMQVDTAFLPEIRQKKLPSSTLQGSANLLIFPDLVSANAAYQILKIHADALPVGPILMGAARPAHILTHSATVRGVINMTAIAVAECV